MVRRHGISSFIVCFLFFLLKSAMNRGSQKMP
uniref:Uncharacterized protein n=1 Tax=Arundo donax TaxID=35708 RepID=A0A0A9FDM4_ARUDO